MADRGAVEAWQMLKPKQRRVWAPTYEGQQFRALFERAPFSWARKKFPLGRCVPTEVATAPIQLILNTGYAVCATYKSQKLGLQSFFGVDAVDVHSGSINYGWRCVAHESFKM